LTEIATPVSIVWKMPHFLLNTSNQDVLFQQDIAEFSSRPSYESDQDLMHNDQQYLLHVPCQVGLLERDNSEIQQVIDTTLCQQDLVHPQVL
jgi:hypothetical protein